nr:calpain-13 isoform X4 [Columba livia]XP_021140493.1 calpain-13 isoform X4 [Columba livia]XP_021140494.1 calpain-13 isoform X4 [Columba livia]XP_021140495.1 calpain-13 isoform X4 [Columba livia]XP_021140496.1 calpain-13 isoform X4 [Columba livia]XP_021140497.1 calpain-13 isoform X4 [Columba livia]XP_021140498.1 calpain-13 isoform X4 [Columba livia]XP_021140499.1 calpain-13 isoform X4 [Columba livia]XP_021140500.1 calpain-13 isoform X4 [Columba livia]
MMLAPGSAQTLEQGWQTTGTTGSLQNVKKFNNQDFSRLRASCLSQGLLFEDATFPAHVSSIGPNLLPEDTLRRIQWKRPTELQRNPYLIVDGVSRFDIMQGEIGDCWMLAALGSLTLRKQFLENVLPKDQGFQDDYAGIFHFRFWQCGAWVDVVIDDRLPFLNGRYLSVQPRTSNEFWPSLLEKAYAKLRGSYQNLHGGYLSDALVDLTGGVQVQFSLKDPPPDLEEILKAADKSHCLMGCSTSSQLKRNIELRNGIVQGHAYTVTGAVKIRYKNGWKHIVRIWNPWGHGEWKGSWSDNSPQWDYVEPKYREALLRNKDDGEFWMSCKNFQEQFSHLYICNRTPTFLDFGDQHSTVWSIDGHSNLWSPGLATGRNKYFPAGSISTNPQYFFKVPDYDPKTYNVVISLMQKHSEDIQDAKTLKIGFFITTENSKVLEQNFSLTRDVTNYFILSPGTYAVVPATTEDQEFEFLLRIFVKNQDYNESSNSLPSQALPVDEPRQNQDSSYKAVFLRYANQDSTIDASQLQQLLNEVILQDEMTSLGGRFSFDSCRGILALMDLNSNGRLTLQEFGSLWRSLTKYMDIFSKEDRNHSGFLDVSELKSAIQTAGLATNEQLLHLMALRYGDAGRRIGFSDFVCCMLRLETMTRAFQNLAGDGSQILMTAMEVKMLLPSLPVQSGTTKCVSRRVKLKWLTLVMYT